MQNTDQGEKPARGVLVDLDLAGELVAQHIGPIWRSSASLRGDAEARMKRGIIPRLIYL